MPDSFGLDRQGDTKLTARLVSPVRESVPGLGLFKGPLRWALAKLQPLARSSEPSAKENPPYDADVSNVARWVTGRNRTLFASGGTSSKALGLRIKSYTRTSRKTSGRSSDRLRSFSEM